MKNNGLKDKRNGKNLFIFEIFFFVIINKVVLKKKIVIIILKIVNDKSIESRLKKLKIKVIGVSLDMINLY